MTPPPTAKVTVTSLVNGKKNIIKTCRNADAVFEVIGLATQQVELCMFVSGCFQNNHQTINKFPYQSKLKKLNHSERLSHEIFNG